MLRYKYKTFSKLAEPPFRRLLQRLSKDPVGSRLSLQSTDGLEIDSPDHASGRQNDRCVTKAQHMLYEGLGLARTRRHSGSCECDSEDTM